MHAIRKLLALALVLGAVPAASVHAQTAHPLSIELRAGASFPTGEYRDGVPAGLNVGGAVLVSVDPALALYLGFEHDQAARAFKEDYGAEGVGVRDDGLRAGARLTVPEGRIGPGLVWLEAGAIYNRVSIGGGHDGAYLPFHSSWEAGFEGGFGFAVPLSPRMSLTPGLRYRNHRTGFILVGGGQPDHAAYVAVDVGVNFRP